MNLKNSLQRLLNRLGSISKLIHCSRQKSPAKRIALSFDLIPVYPCF